MATVPVGMVAVPALPAFSIAVLGSSLNGTSKVIAYTITITLDDGTVDGVLLATISDTVTTSSNSGKYYLVRTTMAGLAYTFPTPPGTVNSYAASLVELVLPRPTLTYPIPNTFNLGKLVITATVTKPAEAGVTVDFEHNAPFTFSTTSSTYYNRLPTTTRVVYDYNSAGYTYNFTRRIFL
jgi:hypothetical protein